MLAAGGRRTVPGLEHVLVFPDDRLEGGFYAVSTTPRVARQVDGRPELSLTVYGGRTAGGFTARGGVLVLTTELAVDPADLERLRDRLAAELAERWPDDSETPPPVPQLLAPEWLGAQVVVRFTPDLALTGAPSRSGDNRCSFSEKLTAEGATALVRAWDDGLPDATVTYTGRLRAGPAPRPAVPGSPAVPGTSARADRTSSSTTTRTTSTSSSTSTRTSSTTVHRSSSPDVVEETSTRSWRSQETTAGGGTTRPPDGSGDPGPDRPDAAAAAGAPVDADRVHAVARLADSVPELDSLRHVLEM